MQRIHQTTIFPSLTGLVGLVLLAGILLTGCGEQQQENDPFFEQQAAIKDSLTESITAEAQTLEHWETLPAMITGSLNATYTPLSGDPQRQIRTGSHDALSVSLSLVEQNGLIRGHSAIALDADISLTGHPIAVQVQNARTTLDESSLVVQGSGFTTLDDAAGRLTRTAFDLTLTIVPASAGKYFCHGLLDLSVLNTRCEFTVEVHRTGGSDPISFFTSTWEKKTPGIDIGYPRKHYSDQTEVQTVTTRPLLAFSINTDALNPMGSGFIDLPAALSPNRTALRLDVTETPIQLISDENQLVRCKVSGTLADIPDLYGVAVTSDYHLTLGIIKEIIRETYTDGAGNPAQRQAARYTCTATLVLDALNTRSTLIETLTRTDSADVEALFAGAEFILTGGTTRRITHAVTQGDTTDLVSVPHGLIGFNLTLTPDTPTSALAMGTLLLPFEATPATAPFIAISFRDAPSDITEGTRVRLVTEAQVDKTDALGFLSSVGATLTLDIHRSDAGTWFSSLTLSSDDHMTRIQFADLELVRHDTGPDLSNSQWAALEAPYHVLGCSSPPNTQNIIDGDLDLNVTLHKRLTDDRYVVSARGSLGINAVVDCTGQTLFLPFSDANVDMNPDGRGFAITTLIAQGAETAELTLILMERESDRFELQGDVILPDGTVLDLVVPAVRIGGTGYFLNRSVD